MLSFLVSQTLFTFIYLWQKLKSWMMINPRLRETFFGKSDGAGLRSFTPKQVQMIVDELGEP
jgi:hypothetical protein